MGISLPPFYDVTDLHALADGELSDIDAARLHGALTPADAARVAQWRRQTELLRAAFGKIAFEPVPLSLSVLPPARAALRAVPMQPRPVPPRARRWGRVAGLAGGFVAAVAAVVLLSGVLDMSAAPRLSAGADAGTETGAELAARTVAALADTPAGPAGCDACGAAGTSIVRLPNLGSAGLALQSSELSRTDAGWSACGLYADRFGVRLALCAAPAPAVADQAPKAAAAHAITWHAAGTVYALAGPLTPGELTALGQRVQAAMTAAP